ncbi:10165_t:CDS:2, partial [Scutellospora calospora]
DYNIPPIQSYILSENAINEWKEMLGQYLGLFRQYLTRVFVHKRAYKCVFSESNAYQTISSLLGDYCWGVESRIRTIKLVKKEPVKKEKKEVEKKEKPKKEKKETNPKVEKASKTCLIDFSSPNMAKLFHADHLRSTIIGNFVRNIHAANGWKTISINYLGLLAIGFEKYGSEEELLKNLIKHLYNVYVKINTRAYFKKMETGDESALALWKRFKNLSIERYKDTYTRLNVNFDVYSGESQISNERISLALKILKEKNIATESNSAIIADLGEYKLDVAMIQKNNSTTLYITRDIGAAMERYEQYKFDAMYYVVASQQDLHFKQLFKILELMGCEWVDR